MPLEIILSIASLILQVLATIIYYSKPKINTLSSQIYKCLMILAIISTVFEISCVFLIDLTELETLILIFWRVHVATTAIWYAGLFLYNYVLAIRANDKTLKELLKTDKMAKLICYIFVPVVIMLFCLPRNNFFDHLTRDNTQFLPIGMGILCLTTYFLMMSVCLYYEHKHNDDLSNNYKNSILISTSVMLATFIANFIIKDFAFIPFGQILSIIVIYFFSENPDLIFTTQQMKKKEEIEAANKSRTMFLSNITYEIKSPMNLIVNLCAEINNMQEFDEATIREDIEQIHASGANLLDIINNVLDISQLETASSILHENNYKLNTIIKDINNIAASKIGSKHIKFTTNLDKNISSGFYGDSSKIYQILLNVVTNAIKYTDVGKVNFTISSTKNNGMETLLFKVSDTGNGIKEADKKFVFKKKDAKKKSSDIEGKGLGLAITKEYVEEMNGKIWFESEFRVGSTFFVEITQKIVDPTPIGDFVEVEEESHEKLDCTNKKALIVDENKLNIEVFERYLKEYNFEVTVVNDGKECVNLIKAENKFDIIFVDHILPVMDGIQTIHTLRKLPGYDIPPTIALTANAVSGMREMYLKEGFDEYLAKPIDTKELDKIINRFLK